MLISVIIPAHNAEATVREALASVEAQTVWQGAEGHGASVKGRDTEDGHLRQEAPARHGRRMTDEGVRCEIIVVDDASTDGTAKIAEDLLQVSGFRFQVSSLLSNAGPAAARNRGIAEAKGDWIAFLDADDAWLPEKLATQMELARQQPDVALWCGETESMGVSEYPASPRGFAATRGGVGVGGEGKDEGGNLRPEVSREKAQEAQRKDPSSSSGFRSHPSSFRKLHLEEFACGNPVATSTVLIRKSALDAVGGFDEQFRGPEDYDLWMRVAARFPVALIGAPLARYRQVQGSLSMDDRRFLPQVLKVLDKAYGPGGALCGLGPKRRAVGYQHLAGAWMAAERGALGRAWGLLFKSVLAWPGSYRGAGSGLRWPRLKLVARFAALALRAGRREGRR